MSAALLPGHATAAGTSAYAGRAGLGEGHYSDFPAGGALLSSIGVGTFPGPATDAVDRDLADIVCRALGAGLNVIDTAAHYRYGRSARAVGEGLRAAVASGVAREAVFLVSKGGFLLFPEGPPADLDTWFEREIAAHGRGRREDLVKAHLLSPEYLGFQLDYSRQALGVATLDAFLVDQPEVQIPVIGKEALIRRLDRAFAALEQAVREGRIRHYGVSSFHAFRAHTDDPSYLSLASMLALAERAAEEVFGPGRPHHFAVVQLPFNAVMLEGFSRFNQITGQGNEASTLQAALQLGVYTVASHALFKGHLARQSLDILRQAMSGLPNDAQRAIQFNRSTPGLGTSLVGMSTPAHLDDALAVARIPPLPPQAYLAMYEKAG